MRVGVITMQYSYNYGAVLQCVALQRALSTLGVQSEVIDYLPAMAKHRPLWHGWGLRSGSIVDGVPKRLINLWHGPSMRRRFDAFKADYMRFSTPLHSSAEMAELAKTYDAVIAGSDQVWNRMARKESVYFLEWGAPYHGRRISYAACFGHQNQPPEGWSDIPAWLSRVDFLSVRNDMSRQLVRSLCGREAEVVADPTLLVDLSDMACGREVPSSGYILTYIVGSEIRGGLKKLVTMVRRRVGNLPVVAVSLSANTPQVCPWADINVWSAGPREWLHMVANATFICTDSFHGVIFAMKYRKPFLAYHTEEQRAPRLLDLGRRYAVAEHIVGGVDEVLINGALQPPDYNTIHAHIGAHVKESFAFLRKALNV